MLSKEEMIKLLKAYFKDDIIVKAIVDILHPVELNNWIEKNKKEIINAI